MDDASYNQAAEQCLLGALLLGDKLALVTVSSIISSRDFYEMRNQQTFEAIVYLANKGEIVDLLTVREELIRQGIFEQVGGLTFLTRLFDSVPNPIQIANYAETIRLCALWRRHD